MRVLIDQHFHLGHHYSYLSHLLPPLADLADEVVVALTTEGAKSAEFRTFLEPLVGRVRFDPCLSAADPRLLMTERWRLHRDLRAAVRRTRPDYVLIPSGDAQTTAMGIFRLTARGGLPNGCPCEVGIHFGLGESAVSAKDKVRDLLNRLNLAASGVARVHVVNLLFYEDIQARGGLLARRSVLMPHPVPANPRLSRADSRRLLGIPEDGRYIGLAASIDSRKAIRQFLDAFRAAAVHGTDRLLLAGWIHPTHLKTIEQSFQDLVDDGRVILLNGFQTPVTFQTTLSALDVVCTPYPGFGGLSSTLLEGVAAGRPILANDFGWSRSVVKRFQLGWTCDVLNHDAFVRAMRTALDESDSYVESEATARLLAFHAPENFAESWLQGLREKARQPSSGRFRPWTWVLEALSGPRLLPSYRQEHY